MEAVNNTSQELEVIQGNPLANLKNVLITEIELKDGRKTQAITFFNYAELNGESLNIGVKKGLERCRNVSKMKSTICSIKTGILKPFVFFKESKITPYDPRLDKNLNHI